MPNRILRDWTDSEIVDKLSAKAEVFFTRLIMKADDFGCYHANAKLLKANLYPLRDNMRPSDITPLLTECEVVGLVRTYTAAGKEFLYILNFGQRLRQANRKFPEPPEFSEKVHVSNSRTNDSNSRLETEVETEVEAEGDKIANTHPPELVESYKKFNNWLSEHTPRVLELKHKITIEQYQKLKSAYPDMKQPVATLKAMHNFKPLTKNYVDAYLTLVKWMKKDEQFAN